MANVETQRDCDVLVIGAGPAGLMLSTWLSKLKVKTIVIDKSHSRVLFGHADGFQCRTVEIFQSFGLASRVQEQGNELAEFTFWHPDPANPGKLHRTSRIPDTDPGTSRFRHYVICQGKVEKFLMDKMEEFNNLKVDRLHLPYEMKIPKDQHSPIEVRVKKMSPPDDLNSGAASSDGRYRAAVFKGFNADDPSTAEGESVLIRAKYVVGCDGARSWVRKQIGATLDGDAHDSFWGVLDVVDPVSDFPDIRMKATIHSESSGTVLIVPREDNIIRFYIQVGTVEKGQRLDRASVTPEIIIQSAKRILQPYTLECKELEWWTVYEIGQRLGSKFDLDNRIFLAGDAIHTHSPKAGQGMNVSMMDAYNLGWKIHHVLKGYSKPDLLSTYRLERYTTAKMLIDFDKTLVPLFSGGGGTDLTTTEFSKVWKQFKQFTSGKGITYKSILSPVAPSKALSLARNIQVGSHLQSYWVVNLASAVAVHLCDRLVSDGRWRILLFAGNLQDKEQYKKVQTFAKEIDSSRGFIRRFTADTEKINSLFDVITITSSKRIHTELTDFPDILRPKSGLHGGHVYDTIFSDDEAYHEPAGVAYDSFGIDKTKGCVVVMRPDQYVGGIFELEEVSKIDEYFSAFLIPSVTSLSKL